MGVFVECAEPECLRDVAVDHHDDAVAVGDAHYVPVVDLCKVNLRTKDYNVTCR